MNVKSTTGSRAFRLDSQRGIALIVALGILFALSLISIVAVKSGETEMEIAGNKTKKTQAFLAAEAGMAYADHVMAKYAHLTKRDTLVTLINAGSVLDNALFDVTMDTTLPLRRVIAVGRSIPGGVSGIQATYRHGLNPYNIWNNAVFAGHGQNQRSIRGNAGLHGSIHILGDGEKFTDSNGNGKRDAGEPYVDANHDGTYDGPLTADSIALSMDGTATLGNNYTGMAATLQSHMPALPTVSHQGETVQTLEASLRVKNGKVVLDGTGTVGQPNAAGGSPAIKETFDGTYVSDGFGGSLGAAGVYSDNGSGQKYDLDPGTLQMPNLDDPYTDSYGNSYASYMAYLKANALVVSGDLNINKGTSIPLLSSGKGSLSLDNSGNIVASGIIYVTGNVSLKSPDLLEYDGRFTIVCEGDMTIDADFHPKGQFATDDVAGLISYGRTTLGAVKAQLELAAAIYAQEEVIVSKQTQMAGTLVSNYFGCTQVPDIYQVPSLTKNLPPSMPGSADVPAYTWKRVPKSWVELD
jgi:hypothetical protein